MYREKIQESRPLSNQLKRPAIVLPKIPFVTNKKGRKIRSQQNREAEMSHEGVTELSDAITDLDPDCGELQNSSATAARSTLRKF